MTIVVFGIPSTGPKCPIPIYRPKPNRYTLLDHLLYLVYPLIRMKRIPRKLKKQKFKNIRLKNLYKELRQNGRKYKQWKEQQDGKIC